jgi:hypothetical protein
MSETLNVPRLYLVSMPSKWWKRHDAMLIRPKITLAGHWGAEADGYT